MSTSIQAYRLFTTVSADKQIVSDGVSATATTFYSNAVNMKASDSFSFQVFWTGNLTVGGSASNVVIQVANKPNPTLSDDNDWTNLTYTAGTLPAGSAGELFDSVGNCPCVWWRLKITFTAGTGTLTGYARVM